MTNKSDKRSFHERLTHFVHVIRTEIRNGIRQEGSYLPSESMLAKQFHLSNKSIRKGLDQLVEEGLIVKIDRVGSKVTSKGEGAITVHFGCSNSFPSDFVIDDLIADFSLRYPGIHIRRITLNQHNYLDSAREMIGNGLLDAVALNSPQFQEWTEAGIGDALEAQQPDESVHPIAEDAFRYGGALYARPLSFSPVVLCYNKRHFAEAGLHEPDSYWTWDDLMAAAAKLSLSPGRHGVYFLPTSENRYPVFLLQSLARYAKEGENAASLRHRLSEGLNKLNKLIASRDIFPPYMAKGNDETIGLFADGRVSMIMCTYYNLNELSRQGLKYDICPLPALYRGDPQKTLLISIGTALVKHSRSREAARQFVEYLSSAEAQGIIRDRTVGIPARRDCSDRSGQASVKLPSRYAMYREMIPSFAYHSELGMNIRQLRQLTKWLKEYWSGMMDEDALQVNLAGLENNASVHRQ
ncbi:extracellular solute-binding protein [Paenibacillus chungangensis]|uniref:Extracellular solute-binding protein n=1 Tax=Paenibacillus chungangensis TaxID=696535 RepID=A0ABW3HM13_9BACL